MHGVIFLAVGCTTSLRVPNLDELYGEAATYHDPNRNPVIVIPGILGSKLITKQSTERVVWGAFSGGYANPKEAREVGKSFEDDGAAGVAKNPLFLAWVIDPDVAGVYKRSAEAALNANIHYDSVAPWIDEVDGTKKKLLLVKARSIKSAPQRLTSLLAS